MIRSLFGENRVWTVFVITASLVAAASGYAYVRISALNDRVTTLSEQLASTTATLAQNVSNLHSQTENISQTLTSTKKDIAAATSTIGAVQNQVGGVEQTVGSMSGTVSTLKKLATIDPELLKKYSKVYFLNENYTPAHLSLISQDYVYSNSKQVQFSSEALPFLQAMLSASKMAGVTTYVDSAYRSFGTQGALKSQYKVVYGAGTANSFSADQGYSEHQLGTAVDLLAQGSGGALTTSFDSTASYAWLSQNAYKFGFVLSYPKGNAYYIYEPWHWRFVGVKLATYLHDNKKNFYDMDQRDIDTYLASLFD